MGIYEKKIEFDFASAVKQFAPIVIGIIAIFALFLIYGMISDATKPQAITADFSRNPLDLTKNDLNFTKLEVTITNISNSNARNVLVEVSPEDTKSIVVSPQITYLGLVEKGNKRLTEFIVRPNPAVIRSGTYTINVYAVINGERYSKQMVLEVKTS